MLCPMPIDVTNERPSGAKLIPSSCVTPKVTCSGVPSGNRCRQMWTPPAVLAVKYIHFPSGDQAASVHCADAGPTGLPESLPSMGTSRHGSQDRASISTTSTCVRSGESDERCAIPYSSGGTYTFRDSLRLSFAVTMDIWPPRPVSSENRIRDCPARSLNSVSPSALVKSSCGRPPSTGTTHVSIVGLSPPRPVEYRTRDPSAEKCGLIL